RFREPTDLFNEIVPPNAVTRRRIIDPRRTQFRLDLDPFFSARRFGCCFLFWCELTRTDRLYNSTRSLPRDVDPTGLKLEGAQAFWHRLGLALVMMRCCLRARACFLRSCGNHFGICFPRARLQPFQLRVAVDLTACATKKTGVERKYERVPRTCERDIKQSLHFLTLNPFELFFHLGNVAVIERDLRLFAGNDSRISASRAETRFAREKGNNHRVPLRSFRLVRGDQLNCIRLGRLGLGDLVEGSTKRERKIGK